MPKKPAPPKRRPNASGPSGKNQVPQRAVRIPDEQWQRLGEIGANEGRDRNAIINQLVDEYVATKSIGDTGRPTK